MDAYISINIYWIVIALLLAFIAGLLLGVIASRDNS
jgi:hypothetical protein